MNSKSLFWLLITVLLTTAFSAQAQQPGKIPRIGYLSANSIAATSTRTEAFRQGLRELGYVEGKTSSLSGDLGRENSIASPRSRPNWCSSMWM
jgi:putative ABC transport system substrate-binding protein